MYSGSFFDSQCTYRKCCVTDIHIKDIILPRQKTKGVNNLTKVVSRHAKPAVKSHDLTTEASYHHHHHHQRRDYRGV